jgi:hypothetical protein
MCSIPIALVGAQLIGGAMQARSQYQSDQYNAALMQQNARIQENAAADAEKRGQRDADLERRRTRSLISSQRAAMAANGIDLDNGSALALQEGTAGLGEEDAMYREENGKREAYNFRVQSFNDRAQAKNLKKGSKNRAIGTLLGAGANAASSYYSMK